MLIDYDTSCIQVLCIFALDGILPCSQAGAMAGLGSNNAESCQRGNAYVCVVILEDTPSHRIRFYMHNDFFNFFQRQGPTVGVGTQK